VCHFPGTITRQPYYGGKNEIQSSMPVFILKVVDYMEGPVTIFKQTTAGLKNEADTKCPERLE